MSKTALKVVSSSDEPKPKGERSPIEQEARSTSIPATPLEVRSKAVPGLLLRVQPVTGYRCYYLQLSRTKRVRIGDARVLNLKVAEKRARAILLDPSGADAAKQRAQGQTLRTFIADEFEPWVTARQRSSVETVRRLKASWSVLLDVAMARITPELIDKQVTARLAAGTSIATVNRDLAALSACFTKWCESSKAPHPVRALDKLAEPDELRVRFLSADEEQRLRKALADRDAAAKVIKGKPGFPDGVGPYSDYLTPLCLIAMGSGMRKGELLQLEWSRVDLTRKQITVAARTSKGFASRIIPMSREVHAVLAAIKPERAEGLVFASPLTGGVIDNFRFAWEAVLEAAEVSNFRFHDARHHFASSLAQKGVSLFAIQRLLGHSSSVMSQRYAHLMPEHLEAAIATLD